MLTYDNNKVDIQGLILTISKVIASTSSIKELEWVHCKFLRYNNLKLGWWQFYNFANRLPFLSD